MKTLVLKYQINIPSNVYIHISITYTILTYVLTGTDKLTELQTYARTEDSMFFFFFFIEPLSFLTASPSPLYSIILPSATQSRVPKQTLKLLHIK